MRALHADRPLEAGRKILVLEPRRMATRAAAARMFLRRPELLVVDDLSSALDVETERLLWERLIAERAGATSLVVSHRHPALRRADQIVLLEEGRVTAVGTLEDLLETSPGFRRLWEREPNGSH